MAWISNEDPDSDSDPASQADGGEGELDEFGRQRRPIGRNEGGKDSEGSSWRSNAPSRSRLHLIPGF